MTPGKVENTSPEAMLSLTRTGCHLDAFSVSSNSSLLRLDDEWYGGRVRKMSEEDEYGKKKVQSKCKQKTSDMRKLTR